MVSKAYDLNYEALVEALLEGMGEGFFAFDRDWRFTAFNSRGGGNLPGVARPGRRQAALGRLSQDQGTEFDRRYRRVMEERTREEFESYSALRPDRYHEVRAFPFGDGVGVAFRDITDRQRDSQALRDRELELARVQRIGGVGGLEVDLANGFRSRRSPEYLHLHGLPASSVNETHEQWVERIHPEDRERVEKHFLAAIAGSDRDYKAEYRIVRPSDGEIRWIRAVAEIERDIKGRPLRLVGAHLDITDRKHAEEAMQESEGRLRAIADALPFLISYLDSNQIFRFINKPYEAWFERPLAEIIGRNVEGRYGPRDV